jgi:S1-C subfamily serine protease
MKKLLLVLLLFICGCSNQSLVFPDSPPLPELTISPFPIMENAPVEYGETSAIVRVKSSHIISPDLMISQYGSGSFIKYKNKNYLVTAYHVVNENPRSEISVFTNDRKQIKMHIVKIIHVVPLDVTLYEIDEWTAKIKFFEIDDMKLGDQVVNNGFPENGDFLSSKGEVKGISVSSSAIAESGMSGGPVLKDGKVVGVITSKILFFGLPSDDGIRSMSTKIVDVFKAIDNHKGD